MTVQEERKLKNSDLDVVDFDKLQDVINTAHDFGVEEKEALKSEIFKQKKDNFTNKVQLLADEHQKAKDEFLGLKTRNATAQEIDVAQKYVKKCYDAHRLFTVDKNLEIPEDLFELLEIEECTKLQKKWLMYFCYNGGNPVEACSKASVSLKMYRGWLKGIEAKDMTFKEAIEDVDQSYADIAEMNLKKMAASNNTAAIMFYLKNKHDGYQGEKKANKETVKKVIKKKTDYDNFSSKKKSESLSAKINI